MKRSTTLMTIAALGCCALVTTPSWGQEALDRIATYEFGQSREPLTVVQDMVRASLAAPQGSRDLAAKLAAMLSTGATLDCKQFICRQLAIIGGPRNVPALAPLLTSPDTADMARYALERMPGYEVDDTLLAAIPYAPEAVKSGIINSLGERRCADALNPLYLVSEYATPEIVESVIAALGKIGGAKEADSLTTETAIALLNVIAYVDLEDAPAETAAGLKRTAADALLLCADRYQARGKSARAAMLYESLYTPAQPAPLRVAAFKGLVTAKGPGGVGLVATALMSEEPMLHGVAISLVRELPGEDATDAFVAQLAQMPPQGQAMLIAALADRGDARALPAVTAAVNSDNEEVVLAALRALARLGDQSSVMALVAAAAGSPEAIQKTARASLYSLRADGVDEVIVACASEGPPLIRIEFILAALERGIADAVPLLLESAKGVNPSIRAASYDALAVLAGETQLPALVQLLAAVADDERAAAEKTVVAVSRKVADASQQAAAVLAAVPGATEAPARCSLLRVLGEIGDNSALECLRAAANDPDAAVQDAAVRALAGWPDAAVLGDLLAIAKSAADKVQGTLALRGYVRLLAAASDLPIGQALEGYGEAMALAAGAEEMKTVLGSLANVKDPAALALAQSRIADEAVRAEAVAASLKIAGAICGAYRAEAEAAVAMILETPKDDGERDMAREVLNTIQKFDDYIVAWHVSEPYTEEGKSGQDLFDTAFPPEDPNAQGVAWDVIPTGTYPDSPWIIGLDKALGGDNRIAYLKTTVVCSAAQEALVELGSDDGVKVWLNGELVHGTNAARGCSPATDTFSVTLKEGENALLVKVIQGTGEWAACIRFRTPDGAAIEGLGTKL